MKNIIPIEDNSKTISTKTDSFEASLKNLETEALAFSEVFDKASDKIRRLEKILISSKTNFPYTEFIFKEKKSIIKDPETRHSENKILNIESYYTQVWWFISWELHENSNYRLFLISEEREICWSIIYEGDFTFGSSITFKKPLIECKREVRLKFCQYIEPFMNSFEKKLKEDRLSLSNELPF